MSLPYHKPPPYERPNWDRMNEGQKRYAMEQYNLALVRRGHRFTDVPTLHGPSTDAQEYIDDFDLDLLGGASQREEDSEAAEEDPPNTQENQAPDAFLDSIRERHGEMDRAAPPEVSSSQALSGSNKRGPDSIGGGPAKKKASEHSTSALPGTSGNTDGMDPGAGGTTADGSRAIQKIHRGLTIHKHSFSYTKRWKFLSFGVADVILEEATAPLDRWALTTSLVNIPWEYAFFYMSPAEWARMKSYPGCFATGCSIKVSQYNPRVAFQTADTTSTTATLNQNKFTRVAIGVRSNSAIYCSDRDYTFDTNEPMKPTGFDATTNNQQNRERLHKVMYGVANSSTIEEMQANVPAYATGQEIGLQRYLTIYTPKKQDVGFPPYDQFCEEMNSMDCIGKCIVDESYSFDYAPLNPKYPGVYNPGVADNTTDTLIFSEGTPGESLYQKTVGLSGRAHLSKLTEYPLTYQVGLQKTHTQDEVFDDSTFANDLMYYKFPMEQASIYKELNSGREHYAAQQSIHVGVRAVPKLSTNANLIQADSWLDTQMYWTVEATLHVTAADPYAYIRGGPRSLPTQQQLAAADWDGTGSKFIPRLLSNDRTYLMGRKITVPNTDSF